MDNLDSGALDRFWSKVDRRGPDECWPWEATRNQDGYGRFWLGELKSAHRVAWEIANGPIPKGRCVLHRCDNPQCVNPAHLWLGTHADNMADRDAKGRQWDRRGENHPHSKLTELDVICIRHWLKDGRWTQQKIADAFGIGRMTISNINTGRVWSHVSEESSAGA